MTWTLLLSLLVKSSVIAGAGLPCARFLAQRPADRVDILRATVCLLLAIPVIMNVLPALDLALLPPIAPYFPVEGLTLTADAAPARAAPSWPNSAQLVGGLWVLGVAAVAGQLLLGLLTLDRWTRQGRAVERQDWLEPLEQLSPEEDRPRLIASERIASPLSWGVAPGFIVVDPASLEERQAARAILAHELAHLRRQDWIFLILSRLALAVFWFNPLVWRLHAVLAEHSEETADAIALETVDRTLYARTLVRLAAHPTARLAGPQPATAMAASARTLKTRIAHIMTTNAARRRPLTVALSVVALAAVATPLAALGLTHQAWVAPPPPPAPPAPPPPMAAPPAPPAPPAEIPVPPAPPAPPAPPPAKHGYVYSYFRTATPAEQMAADQARAEAAQARIEADQARVEADIARRQADQQRIRADEVRRIADDARAQADLARQAAEGARRGAEQARLAGEQARRIGEQARDQAMRQVANARIQMAHGAEQMRRGAQQMREEAVRLRDPTYRAKQIAENRAHGSNVTDEELRDLADKLPEKAKDLERRADELEARSREPARS